MQSINTHGYSLVVSMITPIALFLLPAVIVGLTVDGTFKLILKLSFPSTILSSIIVIFTVVLLFPAIIVAVCVRELKSLLPREYKPLKFNLFPKPH